MYMFVKFDLDFLEKKQKQKLQFECIVKYLNFLSVVTLRKFMESYTAAFIQNPDEPAVFK